MTDILCPIIDKLEYSTDFGIYHVKVGFTDIWFGQNGNAD